MTIRSKYWCNTKLAAMIRKVPKPKSATLEEWRDWRIEVKKNHPIRYYIAEELLSDVQDIVNFIPDKFYNIKYYLKNRFITRTHLLYSNLSKGKWHEFDDRLLYCAFDQFVDFIEIEKAHMLTWCNEEKYKSFKKDKFTGRCPEGGIAYLEWESGLINEFQNSPDYGKSSKQALSAQWQLKAYNWWKLERPNRPDPNEVSGYNEYYEKKYSNGDRDDFYFLSDNEIKDIVKKTSEIEQQYYDEDTKYLSELIERRQELWT